MTRVLCPLLIEPVRVIDYAREQQTQEAGEIVLGGVVRDDVLKVHIDAKYNVLTLFVCPVRR